MSARVPVAVIVLTHDEELNLPGCLASVSEWAQQLFVVDSGSRDRTVEIARQHGATIVDHPFETHARQWQWALEQLPIECEWVLGLDADQRVTPELQRSIAEFLRDTSRSGRCDGAFLNRRQIFRGRWIKHGTYYPKYLLKLFRRSRVQFDPADLIDHHFHVRGPTERLRGDLIEDNGKEADLSFWLDKQKRYAPLLAREELLRRNGAGRTTEPDLFGSPDQRVAWLKDRWYHLPLYWRPVIYFTYRYFIRLGFLDGKQGFVFHVLQGFWLRLLVDIHLDELLEREGHADTRH